MPAPAPAPPPVPQPGALPSDPATAPAISGVSSSPGAGTPLPTPAPPTSATEALSRAVKEFQAGQWLEAFENYGTACIYFAKLEQQAAFERNDTQELRYRLHALACLSEMDWLYRQYPVPAAASPVLEQVHAATAKLPALQARVARLWLAIADDAGAIEIAKRLRLSIRFLTDWQILGPTFPETELEQANEIEIAEEAVNTAFPPLRLKKPGLDLSAELNCRGIPVRWRHLPEIPLDGRIPLHHLVEPRAGRRMIIATWIQSRVPQDLPLVLELNTPARLYHDYAAVAAFNEATAARSTELPLTLRLHAGWNRLLIELEAPASDGKTESPLRSEAPSPWWFRCRLVREMDELVIDAVRDHPIDPSAPAPDGVAIDTRIILAPVLPDFPAQPEDDRTWSDLHRDLLIAWMQAAIDAAGGSRLAGAAVARRVSPFAIAMKDDLRFYSLLARSTPPGRAGFRFPAPQSEWLAQIAQRFSGQSTTALWLTALERIRMSDDTAGACAILMTEPSPTSPSSSHGAKGSLPYEVRRACAAALFAQAGQTHHAQPLLKGIEAQYPINQEAIPYEIWFRTAEMCQAAGNAEGCRSILERIPAGSAHFESLALWVALYDRLDFGKHRALAESRCLSYLAAHPLDVRGWRLLRLIRTAQQHWDEAAAAAQTVVALQPEAAGDWTALAHLAQRSGDLDRSSRAILEHDRRNPPDSREKRMPPPALTFETLAGLISNVESSSAQPLSDTPAVPYEYLLLRDERTDTLTTNGTVTRESDQWIYLRTRRAAKHFQRLRWPFPIEGLVEQIQLRRYRLAGATTGGAPEQTLEGVCGPDPTRRPDTAGGRPDRVTWIEDLAAGDVLQIHRVSQYAAGTPQAADYSARIDFAAEVPCLLRRFSLNYPSNREALWRARDGVLDFSSSIDSMNGFTRLSWERSGKPHAPGAATELRVSFPAPRMSALAYFRSRTASDLAAGEDLLAFVTGQQKLSVGKPRASEATARALFDFVRKEVTDAGSVDLLPALTAGRSDDTFGLRRGNRWEKCRLLAKLLRMAGFEAHVYAIRTDSRESPDPRQLRPVLADDFTDCVVGWHRPFDPVVWLYPHGSSEIEMGQVPAGYSGHPVLRLNDRGPVILDRLPADRNASSTPRGGTP